MMFGESAIEFAAADRQGTESVAAAAALIVFFFTALYLLCLASLDIPIAKVPLGCQ
jgi:hypothetical protein